MFTSKSIFSASFGLVFLAMTLMSAAPQSAAFDAMVTLRAGTIVSVELREELDSRYVEVGNTIDLEVRSNVTVNGKVVIAAGSIAEGEVVRVMKDCRNCQHSIQIEVTSAQSVDGQRIRLRGAPHKTTGRCNECPAVVQIGTTLKSSVVNDTNINA